jgi:peptidylprolyl isomerase
MAADDKPHVFVPPGEVPPGELQVEDVEEGSGAEATEGSTVEVHYVGKAWSSRHEDI